MAEDYVSAAVRHATDAEHLFGSGRFDNAGYLAGYGVECSLKALVRLGGGPTPQKLGHELQNLHGVALDLATLLSPGIRRYHVEGDPCVDFAVRHWRPSLRYERSGMLTAEDARRVVDAARICVKRVVQTMILDGVAEMSR